MTILAFWSVTAGGYDFERHSLDGESHEDAFRILWENRNKIQARFYDIESFDHSDSYGFFFDLPNADNFEEDYNNEYLDGGKWCKALLIPSDKVKQIIEESYGKTNNID